MSPTWVYRPSARRGGIIRRFMQACARDLGIPEQAIRWYREPIEGKDGDFVPARAEIDSDHLRGWVLADGSGIAVVNGQSAAETLRTIAHELYHVHENANGLATNEDDAEDYAWRVTDPYLNGESP